MNADRPYRRSLEEWYANPNTRVILEHFREIEEWLGAHPFLIEDIALGDDWSLVVRATAVTEAVLDAAIVAVLGRPELREEISHIPLAAVKYGKSRFARQVRAISDEDSRVIQALAELRNDLAHGVRALGFTFGALTRQEAVRLFRVMRAPSPLRLEEWGEDWQSDLGLMLLLRLGMVWMHCLVSARQAELLHEKTADLREEVALFIESQRQELGLRGDFGWPPRS